MGKSKRQDADANTWTGPPQFTGTGLKSGTTGQHIVDQEDMSSGKSFWMADTETIPYMLQTFLKTETYL